MPCRSAKGAGGVAVSVAVSVAAAGADRSRAAVASWVRAAPVGGVGLLPLVLDNCALVDVRFVRAQRLDFADEADWQVWLGPQAPADAVQRLRAAGPGRASSSERCRCVCTP